VAWTTDRFVQINNEARREPRLFTIPPALTCLYSRQRMHEFAKPVTAHLEVRAGLHDGTNSMTNDLVVIRN